MKTGLPKCGSLEEAERKLNDLKAFRTVQVDPASTPLPELEQLQMRVAQLQAQKRRTPVCFGWASRRVRSSPRPWVPVTGRFCSIVRRESHAVDARSPIGYARCDGSRDCPRDGEIVPSCGLRSAGVGTDDAASNGCKRGQGSLRNSIASRRGQHSVEKRSRIARSPSAGGFEPRSQGWEEAPSRDIKSRSHGQISLCVPRWIRARSLPSRVRWRWHACTSHGDSKSRHHVGGRELQANPIGNRGSFGHVSQRFLR